MKQKSGTATFSYVLFFASEESGERGGLPYFDFIGPELQEVQVCEMV